MYEKFIYISLCCNCRILQSMYVCRVKWKKQTLYIYIYAHCITVSFVTFSKAMAKRVKSSLVSSFSMGARNFLSVDDCFYEMIKSALTSKPESCGNDINPSLVSHTFPRIFAQSFSCCFITYTLLRWIRLCFCHRGQYRFLTCFERSVNPS